jgi:hypothetical protein
MWTLAFVALVLVVVVVVVVVVRRPRGDDVHSVQNYNHTLGTLEHLSERIGPPTVRPVRVVPAGQSVAGGQRVVPPVPVRGTDEFPDPDGPIVFDEARPVERGRPQGSEASGSARTDRAQRMALDSMNHRRRAGTGVTVAIVVVIVFGALAVIGSRKSHNAAHKSATTTTTHPRHADTSTSTSGTRPPQTTRPTPTTLPTQFTATTTSSGGTAATYTLPHTTYQITLTGTGTCWVQVDASATGKTVWAGELTTGAVQNIPATGETTVQFGTPTLTLQVDTVPVVLPTTLHTPFVLTLSPAAAATPGTTSAATSETTTTTSTPTASATSP